MNIDDQIGSWSQIVEFPVKGRINKPRSTGLTMVIDKGFGLASTLELMELASEYIDFIKLGFGTSALYNEAVLSKKISLVRSFGVNIYPGGTFFEIACLQGKVEKYLMQAWKLGFSAIEISDGTITLDDNSRMTWISKASEMGFTVITEVGKKDPAKTPSLNLMLTQLQKDLESPADIVILEGRESGKSIGVYDDSGKIRKDDYAELFTAAHKSDKIMWEAPLKSQQHELISIYGPNVNLGNIAPGEILALEALRVGLRGDTLKDLL